MKLSLTVRADHEEELRPYIDAAYWHGLAVDFASWLRQKQKYEDIQTIAIEEVREEFYRMVKERCLEL